MSKVSEFQFKKFDIKSLKFEVNDDYQPSEEISDLYGFGVKVIRDDEFKGKAIVELTIKIGEEGSAYTIELVMRGEFYWGDLDENLVDILLKANAPALLLSYVRPIITNITAMGQYYRIDIPYIDFTDVYKEEKLYDN